MSNTTFAISGIDPAIADSLRASGGITFVTDSKPGYPCRQCLRDAEMGDEVLLVSRFAAAHAGAQARACCRAQLRWLDR